MTTDREILDEIFPIFIDECTKIMHWPKKKTLMRLYAREIFERHFNIFDELLPYFQNSYFLIQYCILRGDDIIYRPIDTYINENPDLLQLFENIDGQDYLEDRQPYCFMILNNFHYIVSIIRPIRIMNMLNIYLPSVLSGVINDLIGNESTLCFIDAFQINKEQYPYNSDSDLE